MDTKPPGLVAHCIVWSATVLLAVIFIPAALVAYPLANPLRYIEWPVRSWAVFGDHWQGMLFLAILAFLGEASGRRLLNLIFRSNDRPACYRLFALPLGLCVIGYVAAFLCWAHLFSRLAASVIAAILFAACLPQCREILMACWSLPLRIRVAWDNTTPLSRSLALISALVIGSLCALSFIFSLAPPHQSDALRYHLSVPKLYIQEGGLVYLPHSAFSNFPFTIEMLYGLGLMFADGYAARGVHWLFLIATLCGIYGIGRRYGSPISGLVGCLLFLSIPFVLLISSWGFIEVALSGIVFMCGYSLVLWAEAAGWIESPWEPKPEIKGALAVFGICLGLALGVKYTSVMLAAFLLVAVLWLARRTLKRDLRSIVIAFCLAGAVGSPWYLKNLVVTGNPVFPLANGIFHADDWSEKESALYFYHAGAKGSLNRVKTSASPVERLTDLVTLPLRAVAARPDREIPVYVAGTSLRPEGFGNWPIGWVFIALLPFVFLCIRRDSTFQIVLILAAFLALTWSYTYRDNRFLLPTLALLAPLLAVALQREAKRGIGGIAMCLVAAAGLLYGTLDSLQTSFLGQNVLPVVNGEISRDEFLANTQNSYSAYQWLATEVNDGDRVLIDSDQRTYYADFDYIASDFFNTPVLWKWSREAASTDDLLATLKANVDWVAVNTSERDAIWRGFPAILAHFLPENQAVLLVDALRSSRTPEEKVAATQLLMRAVELEPAFTRYHEVLAKLQKVKSINGVDVYRVEGEPSGVKGEDGGRSGI